MLRIMMQVPQGGQRYWAQWTKQQCINELQQKDMLIARQDAALRKMSNDLQQLDADWNKMMLTYPRRSTSSRL